MPLYVVPDAPPSELAAALAHAAEQGMATNVERWLAFHGHTEGEPIELQALDVSTGRGSYRENRVAYAHDAAAIVALLSEAERWSAPGVYFIANEIDPAVVTRVLSSDKWHAMDKGRSTSDADIASRRVLYVDIDAKRPKGTSATAAQVAATHEVAEQVHQRIARALGAGAALAIGDSGNGRSMLVALDSIPNAPEVTATIKGILSALAEMFGRTDVTIDPSVCDAKRLLPAWGSLKRKGAPGIASRPHRRTALICEYPIGRSGRIRVADLDRLLVDLRDELGAEQRAVVDRAMGKRTTASPSAQSPTRSVEPHFARANESPIEDVARRLGSPAGECPGCHESDGAVAFVGNGLKCLHGRCADKGINGFRTPVDLVAEVRGISPREAVNELAEWYGFEGFAAPSTAAAVASVDPTLAKAPGPTAADPMRGLEYLPRVALVGRENILACAAEPVDYVWQDIAVRGTIVLVAGPSGEGKTTLLFLVLVARMNTGEPVSVLGRVVKPAPPGMWIVVIEGEHAEGSASRKFVSSCALLRVDDAALGRVIVVARKAVRLGSPEWADVARLVAAGLVSDIAIDTVARVAPAEANDEREQVAIFDVLAQTIDCAPDGCEPTVWPIAHTKKNGSGGLEDVSGSTQRVGQADSVLLVKAEREGGRVVSSKVTFAKLREDPPSYPEPAVFSLRLGADGVRSIVWGEDAPEPNDNRPLEARIVDLLAAKPRSKTALATALRRSKADVDDAITNLFSERTITTTDATIGGRPFKVFALRRDTMPHGTRPVLETNTGRARDEHGTSRNQAE